MTSFITGIIAAAVTFPGIILRQIVLQLLCAYQGIPVFRVKFFEAILKPSGVELEPTRSIDVVLWRITGCAAFCTLIGFLTGAPATFAFFTTDNSPWLSLLDLFLIWLGISFTVHSFPNFEDASALGYALDSSRESSLIGAIGHVTRFAVYAAAIGRIIWLDVIYAVIVVIVIPILAFKLLPEFV